MFDLAGKTALVTGGDSGIGLGIAAGLAEAGAAICVLSNDASRHAAARDALAPFGGRVECLACDITVEAQIDAAFADAVQAFGQIDGCFANAGLSGNTGAGPFMSMTAQTWRAMIDTNLTGTFFTLRAAARHMAERARNGVPGGRLVATSSLAAISGTPYAEHYAAAKAGVVGLVNGLAIELAPYGITANALLPGFVETPMTAGMFAPDQPFGRAVKTRIPLRRPGMPRDFAGIAVYLMSELSAYHTGDTFRIDGGFFLA